MSQKQSLQGYEVETGQAWMSGRDGAVPVVWIFSQNRDYRKFGIVIEMSSLGASSYVFLYSVWELPDDPMKVAEILPKLSREADREVIFPLLTDFQKEVKTWVERVLNSPILRQEEAIFPEEDDDEDELFGDEDEFD